MTKDTLGGIFSGLLLAVVAGWFVYWQLEKLTQIEPLGSLMLGVVLGWVMRFFLNRMIAFNAKELSALITALVGAAVVGLFGRANTESILFFYLTGLGFGFFGAQVWNLFVSKATRRGATS